MRNRRIRDPYGKPTPTQIRYAKDLGIENPEGYLKGALSDLIDQVLAKRKPTDDQVAFAKALGIEVTEEMTFDEISDLLDREVAIQSQRAMNANPTLRAGKMIMYKDLPYEIWAVGNINSHWQVEIRPVKAFLSLLADTGTPRPEGYKRYCVMIVSIPDVEELTKEGLDEFLLEYPQAL